MSSAVVVRLPEAIYHSGLESQGVDPEALVLNLSEQIDSALMIDGELQRIESSQEETPDQ